MTLEELLNKLKNLTYRTRDGYEINVINTVNFNHVEQLIRQYALDNHDSEYGKLQGKLWAYEQIISKSNFAPMIINPKIEIINTTPERFESNR